MNIPLTRMHYSHLPTPLEPLTRFSKALGGPNVFMKRDDCTGMAMGGNKCRKLDYLLADALASGSDTIITTGATQSNHVRQTAAFAARAGLRCEALLGSVVSTSGESYCRSGNMLLDKLLDAQLRFVPDHVTHEEALASRASELRKEGRRPYVIPLGGSNELGCLGYAECAAELAMQSRSMGVDFDWIVVATGSCGTQAGLIAGLCCIGSKSRIQGFSVGAVGAEEQDILEALVRRTLRLLDSKAPANLSSMLHIDDAYVGDGYGQIDPRAMDAIRLVAQTEATLLDPVYTGKAMAGLIDYVRTGKFEKSDNVLFLHSGGTPALFAYDTAFQAEAADDLQRKV